MRFFDAERKKNNKLRRNYKKKYLPGVIAYESKIYRKKNACNKGMDYMAVVFSAFPNGIEHKKRYQRNRKRIDKKQPPVRFKKPADYINKERKSPYSGNCNGDYNLAAKTSFGFFKTFYIRFCFL